VRVFPVTDHEETSMSMRHTTIDSLIGELTLVADGDVLTGLYFPRHWHPPDPSTIGPRDDTGFDEAGRQIADYLDGGRTSFDLPIELRGDDFQQEVWARLERIGFGETITYGDIADELGDRALARRVGGAVGRNPLSIIVPCHRVVGSDGSLTGYAGGLERKAWLLDLETPAEIRATRLF
jgi:methylated-DNA-[protein]-cysteine S-methyltransferase